jgi:hypothetical protein
MRELCILGFIISYIIMVWLLLSLSPPVDSIIDSNPISRIAARRMSCGVRPRVHVQCGRTGWYWGISEGNIVAADEHPAQTVFRIEPVPDPTGQNGSFAIRHLETLRLLTVMPPGATDAYMLKLGPLKLETEFELFTVASLSIRSNGIGGLINHRDRTAVRAHGNVEPWAPMLIETVTTRIVLRELPCDDPYMVEDTLLNMVDALRKSAHAKFPPPTPPSVGKLARLHRSRAAKMLAGAARVSSARADGGLRGR